MKAGYVGRKNKKKLPPGITFPDGNGGFTVRTANEAAAADALSQLLLRVERLTQLCEKSEESPLAHSVELSKRLDEFQRHVKSALGSLNEVIHQRTKAFEMQLYELTNIVNTHTQKLAGVNHDRDVISKRVDAIAANLSAVAEGNLSQHNRLNHVDRVLARLDKSNAKTRRKASAAVYVAEVAARKAGK